MILKSRSFQLCVQFQCSSNTQNCETYYTNQCHGYGYQKKCYQKPNYRCWDEPNNCERTPKSICRYVPKRTCQTVPELAKRLVPRRLCCEDPPVMMARSAPLTQNPDCCSRLRTTPVNVTLNFNSVHGISVSNFKQALY